jgi:hypothetical protein
MLLEAFEKLKQRFGSRGAAATVINREIKGAKKWIRAHAEDEPERSPRKLGKVEASEKPQSARSIFDDVDADSDSE